MRALKISLLLGLLLVGTLAGVFFQRLALAPLPLRAERVPFHLPPGTSLSGAARIITGAGVDLAPWELSLLGRVLGRANQIKAGSYEIAAPITALGLIDKLTRGEVSLTRVTLVEGKTFAELRAVLAANAELQHDTATLSDTQLGAVLGLRERFVEGMFLPDTYLADKGSRESEVLRRAHEAMQRELDSAWAARAADSVLTSPTQLLILASIVEKETGRASDRPDIAAVFANRLRLGMPLQSDPTVIYGLGSAFDGNLRRDDLQRDTPWNTYTRSGLPPTPISLPGVAALQAVARPPRSANLYFVARGDGSSEFSSDLAAHNRAVARYQKAPGR